MRAEKGLTLGLAPKAKAEFQAVQDKLAPGTRSFIEEVVGELDPEQQAALGKAYRMAVATAERQAMAGDYSGSIERQANTRLREFREYYQRHDLCLTASESDIALFCKVRAKEAADIIRSEGNHQRALRRLGRILERYGITWLRYRPEAQELDNLQRVFSRMRCERWWRRQVRQLQKREVEKVARLRHLVGAGRQPYCSDWNVRRIIRAQRRTRETLSKVEAINDDGEVFTLDELQDLSNANPENRRAELMVRMRGFEEVAQLYGHTGEFWTFTTPSRFHRLTNVGGAKGPKLLPNSQWAGAQPDDGHAWLRQKWAAIRAKFQRLGIRCYGFRVAEPHHDGTPHWHLLLFFDPAQVRQARSIARHYLWRTDNPGEKGARQHRFSWQAIDPARGSATGYLAKYVSKNINGSHLDGLASDEDESLSLKEGAARVQAWASAWGIRQFQQIGGPSVTVWRELRRMDADELEDEEGTKTLLEAVEAADQGSWFGYVVAMGGPTLPRACRPITPGYWIESRPAIGTGTCTYRYNDEAEPVPVPKGACTYRYRGAAEPRPVPNRYTSEGPSEARRNPAPDRASTYRYLRGGRAPGVPAPCAGVWGTGAEEEGEAREMESGQSSAQTLGGAFIPGRGETEYGDVAKGTVFGVWFRGQPILTRSSRWTIQLRSSCGRSEAPQRRDRAALDLCQ